MKFIAYPDNPERGYVNDLARAVLEADDPELTGDAVWVLAQAYLDLFGQMRTTGQAFVRWYTAEIHEDEEEAREEWQRIFNGGAA